MPSTIFGDIHDHSRPAEGPWRKLVHAFTPLNKVHGRVNMSAGVQTHCQQLYGCDVSLVTVELAAQHDRGAPDGYRHSGFDRVSQVDEPTDGQAQRVLPANVASLGMPPATEAALSD
jgi:hypothetical protein